MASVTHKVKRMSDSSDRHAQGTAEGMTAKEEMKSPSSENQRQQVAPPLFDEGRMSGCKWHAQMV